MQEVRTIGLSYRETQILQRVAEGLSSREIGESFFISLNTVETHRKSILRKLGVKSMAQAVAFGMKQNLIN